MLVWLITIAAGLCVITLVSVLYQRQVQTHSEQTVTRLTEMLVPYRDRLDSVFSDYTIQLQRLADPVVQLDSHSVLELKQSPLVMDIVAIDAQSRVVYPSEQVNLELTKINLLRDAINVLQEYHVKTGVESNARVSKAQVQSPSSQWVMWFHNRSLQLGRIQSFPNGISAMIILPKGRWTADLLAALPDTKSANQAGVSEDQFAFRLADTSNQTIYQWGNRSALQRFSQHGIQAGKLELNVPINYWYLECVPSDAKAKEYRAALALWPYATSALSAILLLIGTAAVLTVSLRTAMLNAMRKVSFVNQVSHELKTPLTNILLFNELLQRDLEQATESELARTTQDRAVAIHSEAKRLQFLIDNVLQFARGSRYEQQLHLRVAVPDVIIEKCLERISHRFEDAGIAVHRDFYANRPVKLDEIVLEQIVDNLLSNVDKYAGQGAWVKVTTACAGDTLKITVADKGPGIPANMQERVFEPFFRMDDSLEAAAGTGIGLANVRTLAKLHGGDCQIIDSERGSVFEVRIKVTEVENSSQGQQA